ncbi:MAG TPA: hypothetical protein VK177_14740 [Flavobacteriales bacterium]|nr:hypothetical protein [Flavobacteriales bacterium]
MRTYEIEIWPNVQKIKKIYMTMVVVFMLAVISFILGNLFWTPENVYWVQKIGSSVSFEAGWPVKLYWYGMYGMIVSVVGFLIVYFMQDKKNPVLALNSNGIFINQQMIKQTLVEWANIARIDKKLEGNNVTLDIYFVDANKIIEKQAGPKKAFLKENLKDGKPLSVSNKFALGDLNAFAEKAQTYKN